MGAGIRDGGGCLQATDLVRAFLDCTVQLQCARGARNEHRLGIGVDESGGGESEARTTSDFDSSQRDVEAKVSGTCGVLEGRSAGVRRSVGNSGAVPRESVCESAGYGWEAV